MGNWKQRFTKLWEVGLDLDLDDQSVSKPPKTKDIKFAVM